MIAYCGLDCSKCIAFLATQSADAAKIADVAKTWSLQYKADIKPEYILCDGCKSVGRKSYYCGNMCEIVKCCVAKKIESCAECKNYPCSNLEPVLKNSSEAKHNLEVLKNKKS